MFMINKNTEYKIGIVLGLIRDRTYKITSLSPYPKICIETAVKPFVKYFSFN